MEGDLNSMVSEFHNFSYNPIQITLVKEIYRSPYGVIYFARINSDNEPIFVKRYSNETLIGSHLQTFINEVKFTMSISHPFYLPPFGFTYKAPHSILYKTVKGKNLLSYIHDKNDEVNLTGNEKTIIAMGIASGMAYLHSMNVVNGDLKPANIFLDKDDFPKIANFGFIKLSNSQEIPNIPKFEPSAWLAPELYAGFQPTQKADVYSFGIILWELYTGHYPFPNLKSDEFEPHIVDGGERPLIPYETPHTMKKLMELCWNQQPELRPSFKKIYDLFLTKKVSFDDVEDSAIEKVSEIVNQWNEANKPKLKQSSKVVNIPNLFKDMNPKEILGFTQTINENNCITFFNGVKDLLKQDSSKESRSTALFEVLKLISTNSKCLEIFIQSNYIEILPFHTPNLEEISLSILIPILTKHPETLTPNIFKMLELSIQQFPIKVMRLFSVLCNNHLTLSLYGQVVDLLITRSEMFIQGDAALPLIHTLYKLWSIVPAIKEGRTQYILRILCNCLSSSSNDILIAAYSAIEAMHPAVISVDPSILYRHLADHAIRKHTIQLLCITRPEKVSIKFIDALVKETSRTKQAMYAILMLARHHDIAKVFIESSEVWLTESVEVGLKLILLLLQQPENCQKIPELHVTPIFLKTALDGRELEIIDILCCIVRKFQIHPQFVQELANVGFITEYINIGVNSNNEGVHIRVYYLIDFLCRVQYVPEFLNFLPIVIEHLKNVPKMRTYALTYCSVINLNPQGRAALIQNNVQSLISNSQNTP
ncbi:TKL family protein kinase [Tritrichomonas foetus]|uniref:TKL family protein kinase n=1 Tax=Tritrichomonas foetus TaxID=1144522 RepID=A0A1J4JP67_9EUKA|nr:TKL family protein kinase [Tritrichomonas foetus]|eukprot:OHS99309.1 TKL family protein kinase [Tritrichomonas foetus]